MVERKNLNRLAWMVAACGALALVISCSYVHDFGAKVGGSTGDFIENASSLGQAFTLNQKDEATFGRSLAISITNQFKVSDDQQLLAYVNYVGRTLVSASEAPDRHYIFGVLETDKIGAFSAPDGYVFVTHGAIKFAKDEAELAGVLGHELTHVIERHGLKSLQEAMIKDSALKATADAGIQQALPSLNYLGDIITKKGYDQKQEFAADEGSVKLLIAAGYDPNSFLRYMKRMDATQLSDQGGGMMSTHPGIHDRVGKVADQIKDAEVSGGATMKERFRANVFPGMALAE
jgi:predicted Zn-dependent protease